MTHKFEETHDINHLENVMQFILDEAAKNGASEAEVDIDTNEGFSVSAHNCEVETVEYNQDRFIEITVYFGKRSGTTSVSDLRPSALKSAVAAACHIAKYTDEDPAAGLADKKDLAFNYPQLELEAPWDINVDQAIVLACDCENAALAVDPRIIRAEEVSVLTTSIFQLHANSAGFMGHYGTTHHEISCILIAKENDEMQRDYSYSVSTDPSRLEPVTQIARHAAERTLRRLGSRQLTTIKAPVIYVAEEARSLLGLFASAIQGSRIYRKASFLNDQLHQRIFPRGITISEHPHLAHALGSAPFDDDAVRTRNNVFIADGVLQTYAMGVYSARKLGMHSTGNAGGTHNLTINNGQKDLAGLIKTMHRGLIITELMGQGTNLVTGDYSRGAGGFWVENGEIQYPVSEITVAGNLKDMFAQIVEVGGDIDLRGNVRTGSILIAEMMIAGN